MKQLLAGFLIGAVKEEDFPPTQFPEVAFVGRSNVGKSSLLNSIVLQKNLAHVSSTPGKTQQINFYPVESKWMFVDLPGYGYAKAAREEREKWMKLNMAYLLHRQQLKLVCILVDSRHDPMPSDLELIELMEYHAKDYVIILTKMDKLKPAMRKEREEQLRGLVQQCKHCTDVLPFSVVEKTGRIELFGMIKRMLAKGESSPANAAIPSAHTTE